MNMTCQTLVAYSASTVMHSSCLQLTWADIGFYYLLSFLELDKVLAGPAETLRDEPELLGLYTRVAAQPRIAEWVKNRPLTDDKGTMESYFKSLK